MRLPCGNVSNTGRLMKPSVFALPVRFRDGNTRPDEVILLLSGLTGDSKNMEWLLFFSFIPQHWSHEPYQSVVLNLEKKQHEIFYVLIGSNTNIIEHSGHRSELYIGFRSTDVHFNFREQRRECSAVAASFVGEILVDVSGDVLK